MIEGVNFYRRQNMSNYRDKGKPGAVAQHRAMLTALFEEYYDRIARYAYLRIGDRSEAEDIAGEVFLKALKSLTSYRERGAPMQAWLFKIAHNLVVDYLRRQAKRRAVHLNSLPIENGADPAFLAEKNAEIGLVTKAMGKLTQQQREVIGLRFFGGLSSKETGSVLNKSDGAVREMQRAAIEKLRLLILTDRYLFHVRAKDG